MELDWTKIGAGTAALLMYIQGAVDRKRRLQRAAGDGTKADVVTAEHKAIERRVDAARGEIVDLIRGPRGILDCMDKLKDKI